MKELSPGEMLAQNEFYVTDSIPEYVHTYPVYI
jgi:hypothetical protein